MSDSARPDVTRSNAHNPPAVTAWVRRRRSDLIALGALAAVTLAVVWLFRRQPAMSDDVTYFSVAWSWVTGEWSTPSYANPHRLGFIFLVAGVQTLLGYTITAYYATTLLVAVLLVWSLYLNARLFLPPATAAASALLLLASPIFLLEATLLTIDWASAAWYLLGTAALGYACVPRVHSRTAMATGVTGGVALFMAVWTKESMLPLVFIAPLFPLVLPHRVRLIQTASIAMGTVAALLVAELGLNHLLFGNPFSRIDALLAGHVGERIAEAEGAAAGGASGGAAGPGMTWRHLGTRFVSLIAEPLAGKVFVAGVAASMVVALALRRRVLMVLSFFVLAPLAYISLAVASLESPVPLLSTKPRYLAPVIVFAMPLLVATGVEVLAWAYRRMPRDTPKRSVIHGAVLAMSIVLSGAMLAYISPFPNLVRNGADGLAQGAAAVRALAREDALDRVISDQRTLRALAMYVPRDTEEYRFVNIATPGYRMEFTSPDDYDDQDLILLNRLRLEADARRFPDGLPAYVHEPPDQWTRLGVDDYIDMVMLYTGNSSTSSQ